MPSDIRFITQSNWNHQNRMVVMLGEDIENPSEVVKVLPSAIFLMNSEDDHDGVLSVVGLSISHCNPNILVTSSELSETDKKVIKHIGCSVMTQNEFKNKYKVVEVVETVEQKPLLDDDDLEETTEDQSITPPIPKKFWGNK